MFIVKPMIKRPLPVVVGPGVRVNAVHRLHTNSAIVILYMAWIRSEAAQPNAVGTQHCD